MIKLAFPLPAVEKRLYKPADLYACKSVKTDFTIKKNLFMPCVKGNNPLYLCVLL